MKIITKPTPPQHTLRSHLKAGDVYRTLNGEVVYLAMGSVYDACGLGGSNAVSLEKGYKTKHPADQKVVKLDAHVIVE